jgi:hypothetical protein
MHVVLPVACWIAVALIPMHTSLCCAWLQSGAAAKIDDGCRRSICHVVALPVDEALGVYVGDVMQIAVAMGFQAK